MKYTVSVIYCGGKTIDFVHKSNKTVQKILNEVFAMFYHGSGRESELFLKSNVRSLSAGDVVCLNGKYFLCQSLEWRQVDKEWVDIVRTFCVDNNIT